MDGRRQSASNSEEGISDEEGEQEPRKFVLSADDTGSGIDYDILDDKSWQTLERYCKTWAIKQAHLELVYRRFERTIERSEHGDFTSKPQFHASLDFIADEFMGTAGEFAAQVFLQTWFLRRKRGLAPARDRRSVDFARLVIMSFDAARLGDYELMTNFWTCVLHRFGCLLPTKQLDLSTRLNTELIREVFDVIHANMDKKVEFLVKMLLTEAETDRAQRCHVQETRTGSESIADTGASELRFLSLRCVLRFSFRHPPLLFPVIQFQRILRRKIIGSRYWLRRRKPASERGIDLRRSLGLPEAYNDVFDRIKSKRDAWVVALGHMLLLSTVKARPWPRPKEWRGSTPGEDRDENARFKQLLGNCLEGTRNDQGGKDHSGRGFPSSSMNHEEAGTGVTSAIAGARARVRAPVVSCAGLDKTGDDKAGPVVQTNPSHLDVDGRHWESSPMSSEAAAVATTGGEFELRGKDDVAKAAGRLINQGNDKGRVQLSRQDSPERASTPEHTAPSSPTYEHESGRVSGGVVSTGELSDAQRSHVAATGSDALTPLRWPFARDGSQEHVRSSCHKSSTVRTNALEQKASMTTCEDGLGSDSVDSKTCGRGRRQKLCAACLERCSHVALCAKCGRRAAKGLKDAWGRRKARTFLVPYGYAFGLGEEDVLSGERGSLRRWIRIFDDDTGAHFFYNVYYDCSLWEGAIDTSKPNPYRHRGKRRHSHRSGGNTSSCTSERRLEGSTSSASLFAPSSSHFESDRSTAIEGNESLPPPTRGTEMLRGAARARLVHPADEDKKSLRPDVILDAHKRMYPLFRLGLPQEPAVFGA